MPMKISTKWDSKHAWLFLYNVVLTADSLFFIIVPSLILGSVTAFAPFLLSYLNLILSLDVPATTSTPIPSHHKRY